MDSYFCLLKNKIRLEYEKQNKSKLVKYNTGKPQKDQLQSYEELEKHFHKLLNLFTSTEESSVSNKKILKKQLINQYEETKKNNIIVGILNIIVKNTYVVSIAIFENEMVYENILLKIFNNIEESKGYFNDLKALVKNNNLNDLSKIILEKF